MGKRAYIMSEMVNYNAPDTKRIIHAMKVASFAEAIAVGEGVDEYQLEMLVCGAILHDIGVHMAEKLYNTMSGFYQQKLGPSVAATFLEKAGFNTEEQGEICYLIAHHHTYKIKDNILLQILFEADMIVNAQEDNLHEGETPESIRESIFVTETGKRYFDQLILNK